MKILFDYIVIGAGFAGTVIAERIARVNNKKVLLIEKRNHIGGNAYDTYDRSGLLVHQYGPHIFHTKLKEVWDYLSEHTEWYLYHHKVLGKIDGKEVPIPFNLDSLDQLFPSDMAKRLEKKLIENFGFNVKVPILKLKDTQDEDLQFLANYIYEKVFLNYTTKQWGLKPDEIDPYVTGRVPVYISKDDRYFQDSFQGIPKYGYTKLFESLLNHPNIKLMLNTDYKELINIDTEEKIIYFGEKEYTGKVIFTGKIDEFFQYKFGELPYRSLQFQFDTIQEEHFQKVGTINYPNDYDFTRITEFKKLTGQNHPYTSIVHEYPVSYDKDVEGRNIPYYPIPKEENHKIYKQYKKEASLYENVYFLGRLAEYTYYDMDAVVAKALKVFRNKLSSK